MKRKIALMIVLLISILWVGGNLVKLFFNDTEKITSQDTDIEKSDTRATMEAVLVNENKTVQAPTESTLIDEMPAEGVTVEMPFEVQFKIDMIDEALYNEMLGKSFKENDVIQVDALRVLTLTYYGFDEKAHIGQMVVNQEVAEEVVSIFRALYEAKYPIEKINLVDQYDGNDDLSMAANNTSSFNFRVVSGSDHLSMHSYGMAIDINPLQNPYITSKGVFPPEGKAFVDRNQNEKGMILEDDLCYRLFTEKGWTWGGQFKSVKDYQHFQKMFKNTK